MVTVNVAPELPLGLAQAAARNAGAHVPGAAGLGAAVLLAAGCYLVYRVSLWLHPFRMCRRCGGSGIVTGFLPWSRAFCYKCNGRGLVPRLGTKATDLRGRQPR